MTLAFDYRGSQFFTLYLAKLDLQIYFATGAFYHLKLHDSALDRQRPWLEENYPRSPLVLVDKEGNTHTVL